MQANRSFWKAVHSLSHPVSVLAILLLLFNDHYLRWHYPSWLTGKLGDFTWLVFAPFIAAMLFSWLSPQKTRFIGLLSIAFIGIWFASFKTIPLVMDLTKTVLEALVGWRGTLGMDASDLLTLPALLISWHIWKHAREDSRYLRPVIYLAFGLGIMGTVATSPPQEPLIELAQINICEYADGSLQIGGWNSQDAGMTWQAGSSSTIAVRCSDENQQSTRNFENGTLYRWIRGERVEYSTDGGESWFLLRDLYELRQEARMMLDSRVSWNEDRVLQTPRAGIVHSGTGNLVLTMGGNGVLVISESGESFWVEMGGSRLRDLNDWDSIQELLQLYFYLLAALAFLVLVTTVVLIHEGDGLFLWLFFGWISWGILMALNYSASMKVFMNGSLFLWGFIALVSLFFIALPMSLWALHHLFKYYPSAILPILISATITCLANFFPMFLWAQGTIPRYYLALFFSIGLTAATLAASHAYFRPKLPARIGFEKEKRKNDAV